MLFNPCSNYQHSNIICCYTAMLTANTENIAQAEEYIRKNQYILFTNKHRSAASTSLNRAFANT